MVTQDQEIYEKLKILRLHGMTKGAEDRYRASKYHHYDMEILGYKANMKDLDAALLLPQLDRVESYLKRREEICRRYEEAFADLPGMDFPKVVSGSKSARHLFTLWAPLGQRDTFLWKLQERGIGVAVNYRAIPTMKYYQKTFGFKEGDFPVAEEIGNRTLTLPLYPKLKDEQVEYVIQQVCEIAYELASCQKKD